MVFRLTVLEVSQASMKESKICEFMEGNNANNVHVCRTLKLGICLV